MNIFVYSHLNPEPQFPLWIFCLFSGNIVIDIQSCQHRSNPHREVTEKKYHNPNNWLLYYHIYIVFHIKRKKWFPLIQSQSFLPISTMLLYFKSYNSYLLIMMTSHQVILKSHNSNQRLLNSFTCSSPTCSYISWTQHYCRTQS